MTNNTPDLDSLNACFGLPGVAKIVAGSNGLPKLVVSTPAASAEVYLHGAQITSWRPANAEEVIFLSAHSSFADGKAIRGGIPLCFPWFNKKADDATAPSHGFVRLKEWELTSVAQQNETVTAIFETGTDETSQRWWPHDLHVACCITIGAALQLELIVTNTGASAFHFEEAMHTYYRVGDVRQVRVSGLDGKTFQDNTEGNREKQQTNDVVFAKAVDNAYLDTADPLEVIDPVLHRRIRIEKQQSLNTVVWNPWAEGAKALADLGDEEWLQMVCVEVCNIRAAAVELAPGAVHTMTNTMTLHPE